MAGTHTRSSQESGHRALPLSPTFLQFSHCSQHLTPYSSTPHTPHHTNHIPPPETLMSIHTSTHPFIPTTLKYTHTQNLHTITNTPAYTHHTHSDSHSTSPANRLIHEIPSNARSHIRTHPTHTQCLTAHPHIFSNVHTAPGLTPSAAHLTT